MEPPSDLIAPFKLEIKDLGERRREITYETDLREGTRIPVTTLWTRRRYFTHKDRVYKNVYLDESISGRLRVVKEILHQPGDKNGCLELEAAARIARDAGPDQARLFVEFLGWFRIPNGVSLVLEYYPLGDIDQFNPEPMREQVARAVAGQLLEGIAVLHGMGIAHRDIKPQNVLVAQADPIIVKIADFGVSKYTADRSILRSRVGTPEYMAPELLFDSKKESDYSNAVDIWSLGCLLYYLLTKKLAFQGLRELDQYYKSIASFPDSQLIEHGVGSSGRCFVESLMSPVPDDRPAASKDLLAKWDMHVEGAPEGQHHPVEQSFPVTAGAEFARAIDALPVANTRWDGAPSISEVPMNYVTSELFAITAAPEEDLRRVRGLLESEANPSQMRNGHTALHNAAKQGHVETVRLLLEYCADTLIRTDYDETALHLATYRGDSNAFLDILHMLVARGLDINAQDATGNTALHLAIARLAGVNAVETVLVLGARTDLLGRGGLTPLLYAISLDREDKSRALLEGGADPNTPSPDGRRPLHWAIESERISLRLVELLVEKGADINAVDDLGISPLRDAVRRNRTDVANFLIEKGADTELGSVQMKKRLQYMQFRWGLPWPLRR